MKGVQIQRALRELRLRDRELTLFGASHHKYELNPRLDETAIREFEARYRISLPEDYRCFLLEIGNGGAGPGYGLFSLEHHDDGWSLCTFAQGNLVGNIHFEFKHRTAWNLDESFWDQEPGDANMSKQDFDNAMAAWDATLTERYWSPSVMDGAIPISHRGCALRDWLVVAGEEYGHIWHDHRAEHGGIAPAHTSAQERLHFEDWYHNWLSACLEKLPG